VEIRRRQMEYKYQTNVKYAGVAKVETEYWYDKEFALDYYNDCDRYMKVEWKHIDRVIH
jgi:hypothetical protein